MRTWLEYVLSTRQHKTLKTLLALIQNIELFSLQVIYSTVVTSVVVVEEPATVVVLRATLVACMTEEARVQLGGGNSIL